MDAQVKTEMIKKMKIAGRALDVGIKNTMALRERIEEISGIGKNFSEEDVELCKYFYSEIPHSLWSEFFHTLNYSDERQKKLSEFLNTHMKTDPNVLLYPGEYIVLLSNPNAHSYPRNRPLRMVDVKDGSRTTYFAITPAHVRGNHVCNHISAFRAATNEEIAMFIAEEVYLTYCDPYLSSPNRQEELTNFMEEAVEMIKGGRE